MAGWILWASYLMEDWFRLFSSLTGIDHEFLTSFMSLIALLATVPLAYLIYRIVNRRNEHFGRSEALLRAVVGKLIDNPPTQPAQAFAVSSAERGLLDLSIRQKERSAYLLSLLILVPLALVAAYGEVLVFLGWLFLLYALYRVNEDFVRHEPSEFLIIEEAQQGLGLPVGQPQQSPRRWYPYRNSIAYFAVSILTLGLFALFWLYVEVRDPDQHFQIQSHLENQVQSLLNKQ